MRAVITVVGKDTVGIIAKVSGYCSEHKINIVDISQSVLSDLFCMIMIVDIKNSDIHFSDLVDRLDMFGKTLGLDIHTMHEDIFNSMHKI
ncbi:MAG: ACT domain-containing protein [Bacillota bacterium]|nr:ACT domain-containing protein [Bacillota bacterium]